MLVTPWRLLSANLRALEHWEHEIACLSLQVWAGGGLVRRNQTSTSIWNRALAAATEITATVLLSLVVINYQLLNEEEKYWTLESQNILGWKGPTRISESNPWPCTIPRAWGSSCLCSCREKHGITRKTTGFAARQQWQEQSAARAPRHQPWGRTSHLLPPRSFSRDMKHSSGLSIPVQKSALNYCNHWVILSLQQLWTIHTVNICCFI